MGVWKPVDLAGALLFRFGPRLKIALYRQSVLRKGADRHGRGCLGAERELRHRVDGHPPGMYRDPSGIYNKHFSFPRGALSILVISSSYSFSPLYEHASWNKLCR